MFRSSPGQLFLTLAVVLATLVGEASAQSTDTRDPDVQQNRAARLYVRGLTESRDGNHQAAIDLFSEASRYAPREAAILLSLSEEYERLDQDAMALFYAEQAVALSNEPQYLHHLARSQVRAGRADEAAKTYDRLLLADGVTTDAVFEAARLKVHLGRNAEAAAAFERLIRMVGDDRILRTQLLQLYGRLDDMEGVERTLEALIRLQPYSEQYYLLLSDFYQKRERTGDAVKVLEQGLAAAEDTYDITAELISLHRARGDAARADSLEATLTDTNSLSRDELARRAERAYLRATADPESIETAVKLLTEALETSPEDASLMIMLGDLQFSRGAFAESADLLSKALEKNPRDAGLWVQTALAYLNSGAAQEAADTAEEATILFPGRIELYVIGGHANMQLYRNAQAIELFERALQLLADDELWDKRLATESHAALGFLFSRIHDVPKSDDHYRRAVRIDSTNTFALNNFAYSLAERNMSLEEAREMATRAVDLEPDNAAFLDTAGWVWFRLGELDRAFALVERAVATGSASATVHMHLGDIEMARGNSDAARRHWQDALAIDPGHKEVKSKLEQFSP